MHVHQICDDPEHVHECRIQSGKISAQPHTFIMHTVLCLLKTMNRTIARFWVAACFVDFC